MRYIGQAARAYSLYRDDALEEYGISGYMGTYLTIIYNHPGITQEMIAEKLVFNKSSVSRQIAELEKLGFVRRERTDEDKRLLRVYATEKGESILAKSRAVNREFLAFIQEEFTPEEMAQLEEMCIRLCNRAKEAIKTL
jgi:DNA-binding MarR family transcriptional regulator